MNILTFNLKCPKCNTEYEKKFVLKCKRCGKPLSMTVNKHIIEVLPCIPCLKETNLKGFNRGSETGYETGFNDGADIKNIPYGDGYGRN